ncbi:unnamed protein product [Amaranthus hypochondriacus]
MTTTNVLVCDLCNLPAAVQCKQCLTRNDTICFNCDTKLHMPNPMIAALHRRTLLCVNCQDLTPWTASGPSLPTNISFCLACYTTVCQFSRCRQSDVILPSTVLIEHGTEDPIFEDTTKMIKNLILSFVGEKIEVVIKERKGSFVIKSVGPPFMTYLSLLDLKHPYEELNSLDINKIVGEKMFGFLID